MLSFIVFESHVSPLAALPHLIVLFLAIDALSMSLTGNFELELPVHYSHDIISHDYFGSFYLSAALCIEALAHLDVYLADHLLVTLVVREPQKDNKPFV